MGPLPDGVGGGPGILKWSAGLPVSPPRAREELLDGNILYRLITSIRTGSAEGRAAARTVNDLSIEGAGLS
jgi:hypothetical protein